jgi:pimeloyl-ACP methyl ester carboxylesterase
MIRSFLDDQAFGQRTGAVPPRTLALHGWARTNRDFDAVLAGPDGPLDAIALDLPGFGASPPPPTGWGAADYATFVAPLLDEMAAPVVVLGHSFGGRVAIELARARPDAVKGLVLTGVPIVPPRPGRRPARGYRVIRALHRARMVSDGRMEAARQRYGSADYRAAQGVMRDVLVRVVNERYDADLAALQCPVTMVWGADDDVAPLAIAEAAAAGAPHVRLHAVPGAGHLTPLSIPNDLRAAVLELVGG